MEKTVPHLLKAEDIQALDQHVHVHQFNEQAVRHTRSIGDLLGLSKIGVHLVTVEPGHDSTQFHFHHVDEEFVYILSGTGIAEIGTDSVPVSQGDFMGFPQKSSPHNLHNNGQVDLVYLMGGTRSDIDICDYPKIERRMYRVDGDKQYVDLKNLHDVKR